MPEHADAQAVVLLVTGDLLFGSRVQGALQAAGHRVEMVADEQGVRARLDAPARAAVSLLVVDLTDEALQGAAIVGSLTADGLLARTPTLGYFSHVDVAARERAQLAGFDLVVPRSRMAREGAALVAQMLA